MQTSWKMGAGRESARPSATNPRRQTFIDGAQKPSDERPPVPTLSDFSAITLTGDEQPLSAYAGKVALVVNTASECGFTPQFEGLEKLYGEYADQGLVVLGFPCNQFGGQEPGDEAQIGEFCQRNYGVSFPMFAKVDVNGDEAHPVFDWLKSEKGGLLGSKIKWNFTKFLVGRDGQVIKRYGSTTKPEDITKDLEQALAA
jgi:glutathione peroxidase